MKLNRMTRDAPPYLAGVQYASLFPPRRPSSCPPPHVIRPALCPCCFTPRCRAALDPQRQTDSFHLRISPAFRRNPSLSLVLFPIVSTPRCLCLSATTDLESSNPLPLPLPRHTYPEQPVLRTKALRTHDRVRCLKFRHLLS